MNEAWPVILFYKYVTIAEPECLAAGHREICASLGLKGRLLVAPEGINGTLGGPAQAIDRYIAALHSDARFSDVAVKISHGDAGTFPKLVVKLRREIVALGLDEIVPEQHNQLSPADWKRMLEEDPNTVVLDVRNRFESDAGKFAGAIVCQIEHFRELPDYVSRLEKFQKKKVLIYCTGGIRCEKASALLRRHGFKDVYQLHGGIIAYQEQFGNEHWQGECFVFDQRMTLRVDEGLVPIGRCAHTGRTTSRFVNCLHDPCHKLFILSDETKRENSDYRLCPECLANGLSFSTAEYSRRLSRSCARQ